jgi:hypothetical protein
MYENQFSLYEKEFADDLSKLDFWTLSQAKNGEMTASENGKLLHSSYNPSREAESICQNISKNTNIIFAGFGLGYHVIAAAKAINQNAEFAKEKKLIIIESDLLHFFGALSILDWEEVFKVENLVLALACPIDQIIPLIENQNKIAVSGGLSDSFVFINQAFTAHDENYFKLVQELIERNKKKNDINAATFKKFSKLWLRNSIKNLAQIKTCRTVNDFLGNLESRTDFILTAAGPSLGEILPHLKVLQKKYKIICVETALKALLSYSVEPDFIIITDPQYYAYKHIMGLKSPSSIMIAPLSVHPGVFRFECKETLLCSDMIPVSSFFESRSSEFGNLGAGGSVASSAWTFAGLCGAKNIYLAGLDLSYPSKQTHIKGSSAEQTIIKTGTRLSTSDTLSYKIIHSANAEEGFDYEGNKVLTDSRMKMFAWWFESKTEGNSEVKTWSLSKKSMKIPGIEFKDVEEIFGGEGLSGKGNSSAGETSLRSGDNSAIGNTLHQGGVESLHRAGEEASVDKTLHRAGEEASADKTLHRIGGENKSFYKNEALFSAAQKEFFDSYRFLIQKINRGVELCITNSPTLKDELKALDKELFSSPLGELIRLSYSKDNEPVKNYMNMKSLLEVKIPK